MKILIADDERIPLELLADTVREACPNDEIFCFRDPEDLLAFAETTAADVAFLDIQMRGMTGLELAARLKRIDHNLNIIFVTGYSQYVGEAFSLRASGYVMKPPTLERVQLELENLRHPVEPSHPAHQLCARCFGNFEVFVDGTPLHFEHNRSKEVLAYLVDRRGEPVDTEELCRALWETDGNESQRVQLRKYISDLHRTLESVGVGNAFPKERNSFSIVESLVDCDYYRFLKGSTAAINTYAGEYMVQYSWAEMTLGALEREQHE